MYHLAPFLKSVLNIFDFRETTEIFGNLNFGSFKAPGSSKRPKKLSRVDLFQFLNSLVSHLAPFLKSVLNIFDLRETTEIFGNLNFGPFKAPGSLKRLKKLARVDLFHFLNS